MANNRIYLRCKGCGDTLFLGKTFSRGYYWDPYGGEPLEDRLNKFYDKHNYCTNPKAERTPYSEYLFPLPEGFDGCDGAFDIVYESNDGTGIEDPRDWTKYGTDEFYPKDGRRPCPFCGGEAEQDDWRNNEHMFFGTGWIGCRKCRCFINYTGKDRGKEEAIAAWNRRVETDV